MARIIPIASGKGGVGKSTLVANLGIALGKAGKTVLLVDLDLGGSNLHTCLGVNNPKLGLSQFIYREVEEAEDLIVETPYPKVYLIAGDGLIPGTANIPFFIKRKLIKQLNNMVADFVLLDLGAGTTNNTLDFFLMSPTAMVITIPETTAILNAYSFLKSALYRALFRSFKAKSPQRELIQAFMTQKLEGSGQNLRDLVDKMAQIRPKDAEKIVDTLEHFLPAVVINMGQTRNDLLLGQKLNDIISKNLTIKLSFMGYLGWDEKARAAVNQRKTLTELSPQGDFIPRLQKVRDKLIAFATTPGLELFDPDDDIDELEAGFKPDIDTGF